MAIITLTTDFGHKDRFVAAIKGTIYSALSDVKIVDISHSITPFNVPECAYVLKNSYDTFPKGTIHIIGINSELSEDNKHIVAFINGHYFICANNGVIGLVSSEIKPDEIFEINIPNAIDGSFPVLDVFVQVACHIARGSNLSVIGKPLKELKEFKEFAPRITDNGNTILGSVIYIDSYGNVVTNIQKKLFESTAKGRSYILHARGKKVAKIHSKYIDFLTYDLRKGKKGPGDMLALYNSSGYIEIAIYLGSATRLLGLDYRDIITINFE